MPDLHTDLTTTRVVLRRWKIEPHTVIALLVDDPGTNDPHTCMMYEHVGQHGAGCPSSVVGNSMPIHKLDCPSASDARALMSEMRGLGYTLRVLSKVPADASSRRRSTLALTRESTKGTR